MRALRLSNDPVPNWSVVLKSVDEAVASLTGCGRQENITAAHFTALGAFSGAVPGFFDFDGKDYHRSPVDEQVEVASMVSDFALKGDAVQLHPYAVLSTRQGQALGGHLLEARVHPMLEVVVTPSPVHLRRRSDPETGVTLIVPEASG
jgi:uncharacterized protein